MANILIVEDENSVNRGIEFTLKKEGYKVYAAENIKEARSFFEKETMDMIICDINLPDGSGLDFIKYVRRFTEVPVIFLTALDQEMDQILGYEAGGDDYITKPFSLAVLVLKVNALFRRNAREGNKYIETGHWRFNLDELYGETEGQQIVFTKNEWKLLRLFLENPKRVLSKGQILEGVFDSEENFFDENIVAVYIRRLREKIEKDAANPEYIRNIRGMGYLWNKDCIKR